jgi:hypothetical protein
MVPFIIHLLAHAVHIPPFIHAHLPKCPPHKRLCPR